MSRTRIPAGPALGVVISLALAGCAVPQDTVPGALGSLVEREWATRLEQDPLFATTVGRHEYDHRLPEVGADAQARRDATWRGMLDELHAIDPAALSVTEQVDYAIFERQLDDRVAGYRFGAWQVPLNADSGFHMDLLELPRQMPFRTVEDYERYLSRLGEIPRYFDEQIHNMRIGVERGMTVPRVVLAGYEATVAAHVVAAPAESVFWGPFDELPATIGADEAEHLRAEARAAITDSVVPAYGALLDFIVDEYAPGARVTLGASELPDGVDYYAQRVRHFTTLDLTAEEIHQIGLSEVARIRAEMQRIVDELEFAGSFQDFLEFLRNDPRFRADSPEALLMRAAWLAKRMDGRLPALFKTLPRLPYGVEPVPEHIAPKYTAGRYVSAARGSTRAGTYWVNTHDLESRTLYTLEALTLHEAVPGHHLQIALSNELDDLPPFRRFSYISAFGEGWGLYSEWLGLEAGFYTDPYSDFGRLTYEMWRACRLVVDTGIHAKGWTRDRVIDYLAQNTALSRHEINTETDRYISWPGQALAYKIGELKIKELRARAERELGGQFDVREFHDAVLLNGSVPLPQLERQIDRYILSAHR